jgi:transposase
MSGSSSGSSFSVHRCAGDNAVEFLEGFHGNQMCDGYSGYNKVPDAKRTACWVHIRRYLIDAIPKGKQLDYTQPSVQGFMYVNRLFELEGKIQQKHAGDYEVIRKARLEKEKPVVDGFLAWLEQQAPTRGSRMAKAVTYILNRAPYLATYLEDGRCSFSNNLSENAIPFVVGRKGWLFSDTPAGAETSAMICTMVENAKANGVNVYQYLKLLLEKQSNDRMMDEELEKLAPWNEEVKTLLEAWAAEETQNS